MSRSLNAFRAFKHMATPFRNRLRHMPLLAARSLATVQSTRFLPDVWFNACIPRYSAAEVGFGGDPRKKPDERTLKLGKTLRILQGRLPTLLQSPLPSEILSPHVSLLLFPTTHPHLPTVSGRVAYVAALWSSPLAWGRIPIIGNVKLEILSERMVNKNSSTSPYHYHSNSASLSRRGEQLVVRWRTMDKTRTKGSSETVEKITQYLGGKGEDEFTGLFIFEFDEEGRIISHTIEHVQEGGNWEKGVGAKVVGLTDWLLGGIRGRTEPGEPCPACCSSEPERK